MTKSEILLSALCEKILEKKASDVLDEYYFKIRNEATDKLPKIAKNGELFVFKGETFIYSMEDKNWLIFTGA